MKSADTQFYRLLGSNISERRLELDLTQAELAKKVGVSQPLISAIEKGRVQIAPITLHRIIQELDTSYDALTEKKKKEFARIEIPKDYLDWLREFEASRVSLPKKLKFILKEITDPDNIITFIQEEFPEDIPPASEESTEGKEVTLLERKHQKETT